MDILRIRDIVELVMAEGVSDGVRASSVKETAGILPIMQLRSRVVVLL